MGLFSKGRLLAMSTNIRLGQKWLLLSNTLAYNAEILNFKLITDIRKDRDRQNRQKDRQTGK